MNTIVCIKQVPAKETLLAIVGNWINESDIGFAMNEPDSYALEEALRLKEKHGGQVVALSLGPERASRHSTRRWRRARTAGSTLRMIILRSSTRWERRRCWRPRLPRRNTTWC